MIVSSSFLKANQNILSDNVLSLKWTFDSEPSIAHEECENTFNCNACIYVKSNFLEACGSSMSKENESSLW